MWPYWLMFIFPAFAAIHNGRVEARQNPVGRFHHLNRRSIFVIIALSLIIGFRHRVGGDWVHYLRHYEALRYQTFEMVLSYRDLGYQLIQWVNMQLGWGIYGVNLFSGALFSFGLVVFCRNLPRPWLALTVAMPYLVIVVGMGYTRQGIAIGLAMLGLVALGRHSIRKFVLWVLMAATFHKSAILLLPIAALSATRRRYWTAFWIVVVTLGAFYLLVEESVDYYMYGYIEREYHSAGALIRLIMNALPAAILLIWWRRFEMNFAQYRLWWWCSIISIFLLVLFFIIPSSTAVDRIALLFIPLQLAVFSYVPEVFGARKSRNAFFTSVTLLYYASIQYVWLNYASHAYLWVPYQFYPLINIW